MNARMNLDECPKQPVKSPLQRQSRTAITVPFCGRVFASTSLTAVRLLDLPNRREQPAEGIQGLRFFCKNGNLVLKMLSIKPSVAGRSHES
jgi:hypothetical protein